MIAVMNQISSLYSRDLLETAEHWKTPVFHTILYHFSYFHYLPLDILRTPGFMELTNFVSGSKETRKVFRQVASYSRIPMETKHEEKTFVPALGISNSAKLYQAVVDVFCRDGSVKQLAAQELRGQNMRLLDVACGPGKLIRMIAQAQPCCQITGMDIDPAMVSAATERTENLKNVTVIHGDVRSLPFESNSFDMVVESLMFHHLNDVDKVMAIAQIDRVLKKKGSFVFIDWIQPSNSFTRATFAVVEWLDGAENVQSHKNNQILRMIEQKFRLKKPIRCVNTSVGTLGIANYEPLE